MAKLKLKPPSFKWSPFSMKQLKVMTWWMPGHSPHADKDAIICDGSVRAGKTVCMSFSFVVWATETYSGEQLGLSGKTIGALRRNVIGPLKRMLVSRGYRVHDNRSENVLTITRGLISNRFFLFGGRDESSQDLIAGITLGGMFFDEVALMPKSFVDQATARCSLDQSKLWFNCNPDGPYHWFKLEWLDQLQRKNALHLHFTMEDNLSLSDKVRERYSRMYSGIFYKRYILGLWVVAEGIIYDMFTDDHKVMTVDRPYTKYYVACDYGTQNPTTFGLWGLYSGVWYKVKEYHYDGRAEGKQKTGEDYYADLIDFVGDRHIWALIIDPSAASFIAVVEKYNPFPVERAINDVVEGIRNVASALKQKLILFNDCCTETFREFASYMWDIKAQMHGEDKPVKQYDHQMDGDRYFVNTIMMLPEMQYSNQRLSGW